MTDREKQLVRLQEDLAEAQRTISMLQWQLRLVRARLEREERYREVLGWIASAA